MTLDTLSQSAAGPLEPEPGFQNAVRHQPVALRHDAPARFLPPADARRERLVDIAADAGFADQSHMTRQFISRFGLSGRWLRAIRG